LDRSCARTGLLQAGVTADHAATRQRPSPVAPGQPQCRSRPSPRYLLCPSGTAQSPAATDSSARSATVVHRGQHLPGAGGDAAIGAACGGGLGISRSPGRRPGRASRRGPRGSPFHGLDGVEDARTWHDAPSPSQFPHRGRAARQAPMPALGVRHRPATSDGEGALSPANPEPSTLAVIRKRLPDGQPPRARVRQNRWLSVSLTAAIPLWAGRRRVRELAPCRAWDQGHAGRRGWPAAGPRLAPARPRPSR
jgi:hypothetical protein